MSVESGTMFFMTCDPLLVSLPPRQIARVLVDIPLPHLDRLFDYEVPKDMDELALPGVRVRVRFAGRLCDGFIVKRVNESEVVKLAKIDKVVLSEQVLTPAIYDLIRAVADYYAGCAADVVRLAIPPRHATTEKAPLRDNPVSDPIVETSVLKDYPGGAEFLQQLIAGASSRIAWHIAPVAAAEGSWTAGFVEAAAATLAAGKSALLLASDARDLDLLAAACQQTFGRNGYVLLTAETGPAARYRAFLAALRGQARVVIGTRTAVFAPIVNLGLIALYDDGDDLWSDPRAPYPHTREIAAMRSSKENTALLLGSYSRTAEVAWLVERGWLTDISYSQSELRRRCPAVRAAVDHDRALDRDLAARVTRLPHEVFTVIRRGLLQGPVLIQVPRAGYRSSLLCQDCRESVRCPECCGPLNQPHKDAVLSCSWCGRLLPRLQWRCRNCGSGHLRATTIGADRTLDELGKAFPGVALLSSSGAKIVTSVDGEPRIVVATTGGEPYAEGGYAAAVLLDGSLLLQRADLRASEEALRRWSLATALVKPAAAGGTVVVVAPSDARATQTLLRYGHVEYSRRELADRAEAHFPPIARWVEIDGDQQAVNSFAQLVEMPEHGEILGPVPVSSFRPNEEERSRLILRVPVSQGKELVGAVKTAISVRSARKETGALRVRVDPAQVS
ncbi:MAG: primosomal protein N' [Propionibacteriaceae bacterium]